jgi:hypothetical protein
MTFWFEVVVYQRFPSGPAVIATLRLEAVGVRNVVMTPDGVTRPM